MKKRTYKDWWEGKVYFEICALNYNVNDKIGQKVTWTDFKPTDAVKIKDKQKEIFNEERIKLLEKYKNIFLEGYKNSETKDFYLKCEIGDFERILFDYNFFDTTFIGNSHTLHFGLNELIEIRKYITDIIVKGGVKTYDFIHSPNYKFQIPITNKPPSPLYAQVVWDYLKWLKGNFLKIPELIWKAGNEDPKLNEFSRALYHKNFINKPTDFIKIFSEQKQTSWNGTLEQLVYLFYVLAKKKKKIKVAGYLLSIEYFFIDFISKVDKKNNLKDVLYDINTRNKEKYMLEREFIDKLTSAL